MVQLVSYSVGDTSLTTMNLTDVLSSLKLQKKYRQEYYNEISKRNERHDPYYMAKGSVEFELPAASRSALLSLLDKDDLYLKDVRGYYYKVVVTNDIDIDWAIDTEQTIKLELQGLTCFTSALDSDPAPTVIIS